MYASVKEVHIAVYQRLQQIGSNYHQSIASQYVDMVLNNAMRTVIRKKFDDRSNYKKEGFEESVQRYDDLQSLKRYIDNITFNQADLAKGVYSIDLPFDYMNLISCNVTVSADKARTVSLMSNKLDSYVQINTDSERAINVIVETPIKLYQHSFSSFAKSINLNDKDNQFVIYKEIINILKLIKNQSDNKIDFVIEDQTVDIVDLKIKIINRNEASINRLSLISELGSYSTRLVSSNDKDKLLNNYYYTVNAYKAPLATIRNNKIVIVNKYPNVKKYKELTFDKPTIEYLAYPVEFNIDLNTMPQLLFIDDVVNTAVTELLLVVKDPTVNLSKQSETQI